MAGDATIGALRVLLGLDSAEFEDGVKRAASSFQSFGKKMTEIAAGIGLEASLEKAAHAIVHLVEGALEMADAMGKASQKFGVPIEQLSSLAHVAALSDLSLQQLGTGLGKLSKNMVAAQDSSSDAGVAFGALGISVKDSTGKLKSSQDVLLEVATRFSQFEDGATKTALAMALFGKAGADMIPLLNQGADAIQKQREQAEKLGQVITKETAKQAEEFNDAMKSLGRTFDAVILKIMGDSGMLQAMSHLATKFIDTAAESNKFKKTGDDSVQRIGAWTTTVDVLTQAFKALGTIGYATLAPLWYLFVKGDPTAAFKAITDSSGGLKNAFVSANQALKEQGNALLPVIDDWVELHKVQEAATIVPPPPPPLYDPNLIKAIDQFIASTKKSIEVQQADIKAHGQGVGAREALRIEAEAVNVAFEKGGELGTKYGAVIDELKGKARGTAIELAKLKFSDQLIGMKAAALDTAGVFADKLAPGFAQAALSSELLRNQVSFLGNQFKIIGPDAEKLNQAMLNINAAKLTQEFLSPWEQYELRLRTIIALQNTDMPISAETARLANLKAAYDVANAYGQAVATITTAVSSMFKDLASMNKKWAGAAKAAAIAEALVNTFVAATKALASVPVPLNYAAAAAVTAAGLVQVAKIASTSMAQGGTFKVPGGISAVDSQMVPLALAPGERVDVTPAGRERDRRGAGREIVLSGISGRDLFSGAMLRDLIDALNQGDRDGYRLKFAER